MADFSNLSVSETLFPIGALCKVCGVTRRMVLNYEDHGLIQPISIHEESGHRYYGAQSMARVRHIRALQKLGVSLDDIARFMAGDEDTLHAHLEKLQALKAEITDQIRRTEALLTPLGEFHIQQAVLPGRICAITTEPCKTPQERFLLLWRFTAHVLKQGWRVSDSGGLFSILHTKPGTPNFGMTSAVWPLAETNAESVQLEPVDALYINVRGPYDLIPQTIATLRQHAQQLGLPSDGDIRIIYLTSPQSHLLPENYVTQVYLEL